MSNGLNMWPPRPAEWPDIMNEIEAAQMLRLDEGKDFESAKRSLRHLRTAKGLPSTRVGSRILFLRESVEKWLAAQECSQVAAPKQVTKGGIKT